MRTLTKIVLMVVAVVCGIVFMQNSTTNLLLFIVAFAVTLTSIYLAGSFIFEKLGSILGSFLSKTLFGNNENVLVFQSKYNEAMGYNSFGPNKVVVTESQISIKQYNSLYSFLLLLTVVIFFVIYSVLSSEITISFSDDNFKNKLYCLLIGLIVPIYMAYIQISNIFFSIYLTNIFINENKISLKTRFGKEQVFNINNFQDISFSYRRYFDGARKVYHKIFLHYKGKKYSIICDLYHKKQAQFAILSLENALKNRSIISINDE